MLTSRAVGVIMLALTPFLLVGCGPDTADTPAADDVSIAVTPEQLVIFITDRDSLDAELQSVARSLLSESGITEVDVYSEARLLPLTPPDGPTAVTVLDLYNLAGLNSIQIIFVRDSEADSWRMARTFESLNFVDARLEQCDELQWVVFTNDVGQGSGLDMKQDFWCPIAVGTESLEPFTYASRAYHVGWGVMDVQYDTQATLQDVDGNIELLLSVDAYLDDRLPQEGTLVYRWDPLAGTFIYQPEQSTWTQEQFDALWEGTDDVLWEQFPALAADDE